MNDMEQRIAALEHAVAELEAGQAITGLLSRYAVAVDDKRPELLCNLFTDDATVSVPEWQTEAAGLDAIMAFYRDYWARFDHPRRYFANPDLRVDGDTASCFMYWHVTQERNGQPVLGWGTYDWRFRRLGRHWHIAGVLINILAMTTHAAGWAGEHRFTDA